LIGPEGSLTQQIAGIIPSHFLGPPGTGKTTLAQIIAQESQRPFFILSAINSGVRIYGKLSIKRNKVAVFTTKILFYLLMRFIDLASHNKILY
jgi:replication-associated recombination protein RarA